MNEEEILNKLKTNLLNIKPELKDKFDIKSNNIKKQKYYLANYKNNLFEDEENNELGKGVEAVRSSAAMIFNLIGKKGFTQNNGTKYRLYKYEDILRGIGNNRKYWPHLDTTLENVSERLFVEAKCLEWINTSSAEKLKSSYLEKKSYKYAISADTFIPFFKRIIKDFDDKKKEYESIYKRYDAKQMAIHTLGIYNWCLENKENGKALPNKIKLLNVVWKYDCPEYKIEENESYDFIKKANGYFRPKFKDLGTDFIIEYITFQDFKASIDFSNDSEREEYLKRYEV